MAIKNPITMEVYEEGVSGAQEGLKEGDLGDKFIGTPEMFEEDARGPQEEKYIVRGRSSGVFFGEIEKREGSEVTMKNVRRLWYWDGAASISQLAKEGTKCPENCKFTVTAEEIIILDAIEIDKCTAIAIKSIEEVPEWRV